MEDLGCGETVIPASLSSPCVSQLESTPGTLAPKLFISSEATLFQKRL